MKVNRGLKHNNIIGQVRSTVSMTKIMMFDFVSDYLHKAGVIYRDMKVCFCFNLNLT